MRIAVVDVAAESGGALSVLNDFLSYIAEHNDECNEYYVFVSKEIEIVNPHIHYILKPKIKTSWVSRIRWERFVAVKELDKLQIDVVFSLQNTAFFTKRKRQIVYFHNVLLLEPKKKYSIWKKEERLFGIYTRVIAPYTMRSLKNASTIVCQTNTVKGELQRRVSGIKVVAIYPNVQVDDAVINTSVSPIRGFIYPTAAVPFKQIEELVKCVVDHEDWFTQNNLEVLITIDGTENEYAKKVYELGQSTHCIKFIGYQLRERILVYYRDHALLVNSELESFPLPFREAELIGTPIIAANYPYAEEILANNLNSCTYTNHDLDDMFSKMVWTVENTGQRQYSPCAHHNTWKEVVQEIIE